MEFLHNRIILRILLGAASVVCLTISFRWFRATLAMFRNGKAQPLPLPLPLLMLMDIMNASRKLIGSRLPEDIRARFERANFESTLSSNYLKAFLLLILGLIAAGMVYRDIRYGG
jgi:hypothetical protein